MALMMSAHPLVVATGIENHASHSLVQVVDPEQSPIPFDCHICLDDRCTNMVEYTCKHRLCGACDRKMLQTSKLNHLRGTIHCPWCRQQVQPQTLLIQADVDPTTCSTLRTAMEQRKARAAQVDKLRQTYLPMVQIPTAALWDRLRRLRTSYLTLRDHPRTFQGACLATMAGSAYVMWQEGNYLEGCVLDGEWSQPCIHILGASFTMMVGGMGLNGEALQRLLMRYLSEAPHRAPVLPR